MLRPRSLILSLGLLFSTVVPIYAKSCSVTPEFVGPFSTLFGGLKTADDCSYPEENSSLNDEVIYAGDISCSKGTLAVSFTGKISLTGSSDIEAALKSISTYAIGGSLMDKAIAAKKSSNLVSYTKVVEAYKNYDLSHLYREAYAEGATDYESFLTWADTKGLTIKGADGSSHLNPSIFAATQVQTSLRDQILSIIETAEKVIVCNDPDQAGVTAKCSTFYYSKYRDKNSKTSLKIAGMILEKLSKTDPIHTWKALTDKEKFEAYTLHLTESNSTFALLVPVDNPNKAEYIEAVIPETTNAYEGAKAEYARINSLTNVLKIDESDAKDKAAAIKAGAQGGSTINKLLTVAKSKDPNCVNAPAKQNENMGATADSVKNKGSIFSAFTFTIDTIKNLFTTPELYYVYVFSPAEVAGMDKLIASDDNATLKKMMPLTTTGFDTKIGAPQDLKTVASTTTFSDKKAKKTTKSDADPSDPEAYITASVQPIDSISQPGGWLAVSKKYTTFGAYRPLKSSDNIKDQSKCLLEDHVQLAAQSKGEDLVADLDAAQFSQSNCPSPLVYKRVESTNVGDCSGTKGKALTAGAGACQLCNTDNLTGTFTIPPKMKEVLESAAQENNVPASVILAIMNAEGGFERPQCYGQWTDAMVCSKSVPNCDSCNVSSSGAKGPFQVISSWFPESQFGSACNFTDSARAIASNHRTEKDGNPCWVKNTTDPSCSAKYADLADVVKIGNLYQCGIHTVNMGRSQGSGLTCADWTEQDVATAARAFRGVCDDLYITRVINYWKMYTCR